MRASLRPSDLNDPNRCRIIPLYKWIDYFLRSPLGLLAPRLQPVIEASRTRSLQSDGERTAPCSSVRSLLLLSDPAYDLRIHVRYLTSDNRFSKTKRWCRNSTSLKVRNGGTESSTNSVSDVSRTNGRPPILDKIEDADGVGMAGLSII